MKIETYRGWKDAYRISNSTVDLVVIPRLGRIMRYGMVGGDNILWENPAFSGKEPDPKSKEWQAFGGDKLWLAPQSFWGWPPPNELDYGPYVGTPILNGIKLVGPKNARFGIHFEREITLNPKSSEVTIINRMVNDAKYTVRRSLWPVAQIDNPDRVTVGLHTTKEWPKGYYNYERPQSPAEFCEEVGTNLVMKINPKETAKYGFAARDGVILAVKGKLIFTVTAKYQSGKEYPDKGSAQQVFLNNEPDRYVEMELTSPMEWVKPGESKELVVHWTLSTTMEAAPKKH